MRLLTLNLWKNEGNLAGRLEAAAHQIAALAPDILCLQEVYQDATIDVGAWLADACGMAHITAPARWKERGGQMSASGVAIATVHPILDHAILPLPSNDTDGGRVALRCDLSTLWGPLRVISLHLSHLRTAEADGVRARQWRALQDWSQEGYRGPCVFAGDFNARDSDGWLKQVMAAEWLETSAPALVGQSTLRGASKVLIDHVLLDGRGRLLLGAASIVMDGEPQVSDHFGLMVHLKPVANS